MKETTSVGKESDGSGDCIEGGDTQDDCKALNGADASVFPHLSQAVKVSACTVFVFVLDGVWFCLFVQGILSLFSFLLCPSKLRCTVAESILLCLYSKSPDPVGSITGDRLHAAALLHNHVYVGFHDLCDLSNLEMYK